MQSTDGRITMFELLGEAQTEKDELLAYIAILEQQIAELKRLIGENHGDQDLPTQDYIYDPAVGQPANPGCGH
jgi:hypothetical protein